MIFHRVPENITIEKFRSLLNERLSVLFKNCQSNVEIIPISRGGTGSSLSDPGSDRILFWDESSNTITWLACGNSIAITTTTIDTIQDIRNSASPTWVNVTGTGLIKGATGNFGNVVGGNYSEFESDGTLKFNGTGTVYNDIIIQGSQLVNTGSSAPDLVNFVTSDTKVYAFDGSSTVERLYGSAEIQHDYEEGSSIEVHVHWSPLVNPAVSQVVKWQVYYNWANKDDTFSSATLLSELGTVGTSDRWKHKYTSIATIDGTGKKIGSIINFQLFRDPTDGDDTYADDAALLSVGIHYKCDTVGSRTNSSK